MKIPGRSTPWRNSRGDSNRLDSAANIRQAQDEERRVDGAGDDDRNRLSDWSLFEPIRKDRAGLEIDGARILAAVAQPAVVLDEVDAVRLGLGDQSPGCDENRLAGHRTDHVAGTDPEGCCANSAGLGLKRPTAIGRIV